MLKKFIEKTKATLDKKQMKTVKGGGEPGEGDPKPPPPPGPLG